MAPESSLSISIITVSLNASATIKRAIESVINQSCPPREYIVVDGGSIDGTLEIVRSYGDKITTTISERDEGISDAFNKGIKLAKGDIIGILNADDWYEVDTLEVVHNHMREADVLHGQIQYWTDCRKDYLAEGSHQYLKREMTVHHPTLFVRKSVYEELGPFKLHYRFAMDYELVLRFFVAGKRFLYIPKVLANMSSDGTSDRNWKKAIEESKIAKIENGIAALPSQIYYVWQVLRTFVARRFKNTRLNLLLSFYRKHFSLVRKHS